MNRLRDLWVRIKLICAVLFVCVLTACSLGGCASLPHTQTVLVPCKVAKPATPAFPADTLAPDADIFTQAKTLLSDRKVRQGYEGQLETAVASCQ